MQRLGIISNPYSRAFQRNPDLNARLKQMLKNEGQFHSTKDIEELKAVCQEFSERQINLIGLCGGDGSLSLCLTEIEKAYKGSKLPHIVILGGGTINILSRNINRSHCPRKNLSRLLKNLQNKNMKYSDYNALLVEGTLGFLFADGLAPRFLKAFYQKKKSHVRAFLFLFEVFFDGLCFGRLTGLFLKIFKEQNVKISLSYKSRVKEFESKCSLSLASTLQKMPYGLKVFHKKKHSLASFLAYNGSNHLILKDFLKAFMTSNISNARQEYFENITLLSKGPYDYTLDGEIYRAQTLPLEIKIGPRFHFLNL